MNSPDREREKGGADEGRDDGTGSQNRHGPAGLWIPRDAGGDPEHDRAEQKHHRCDRQAGGHGQLAGTGHETASTGRR